MSFVILFLVGLVGVYLHWLKRRFRRQTLSSVYDYLSKNWNATRNTLIALFAAITGFYQLGNVDLSSQWLANAFMAGYGLDSMLNKSPEEK